MSDSSGGSIGFCGLLTIVFIILKLCSVIHWSWVAVFSPMWIPFVVVLVFALIIGIVNAISKL